MKRTSVSFCCACFSTIVVALSLLLLFSFPRVFKSYVNQRSSLVNGSLVFDTWQSPPKDAPVYMKFYLFNVTNHEEVLNNGAKLNVSQTKVISYRELQKKENVSFTDKDEFVSYLNKKWYVFDEATSEISESDWIISPNFLYWTVLDSVKDAPLTEELVSGVLNELAKKAEYANGVAPFYNTSIGDLLWGQNGNAFLKAMMSLDFGKSDAFGFQINNSVDGNHTVWTGVNNDNRKRGEQELFNSKSSLSYWGDEYANMINGTDGTLFSTFMHDPERLYVFSPDLCRSIYLTKDSEEVLKSGVRTSKYTAPSQVFNVTNPENAGFCLDKNTCKDGLLDVSKCYLDKAGSALPPGLPFKVSVSAIISSPHFLYADKETQQSVNGLHPDLEKHETFLNIHMETGAVLKASKRIQFSTLLQKSTLSEKVSATENLPDGWQQLAPIFWAEEELDEDESMCNEVSMLDKFVECVTYAAYGGVVLGIALFTLCLAVIVFCPASDRSVTVNSDNSLDDDEQLLVQQRQKGDRNGSRSSTSRNSSMLNVNLDTDKDPSGV